MLIIFNNQLIKVIKNIPKKDVYKLKKYEFFDFTFNQLN